MRKKIDYRNNKNNTPRFSTRQGLFIDRERNKCTREVYDQIQDRILIVNTIYSLILLILVENLSSMNILGFYNFAREYTVQFIVNYCLIFIIVSFSLFLKRKVPYRYIIGLILVVTSVISGILLNLRNMPLFPYDILSFREAIRISNHFLNVKTEILVFALIVISLIIFLVIFILEGRRVNKAVLDRKSESMVSLFIRKRKIGKRNFLIFIVVLTSYLILVPQLTNAKILNVTAWNMTTSYEKNGFTYSFLRETILSFRKKPKHYSEKNIKKIRKNLDIKEKKDNRKILKGNKKPNIIVVQLEAFMDPTRIKGVKFNKDPMPNTRNLMRHFTSGLMEVPVTGGGTARTEYEVLSGASFEFLNSGEIPYQTFLSQKPSESLVTTLNKNGYKSIAIHNFYQNFYNRNKGLENIGFSKFVPLDVMTNVEYTPMYWPKDEILTKYISEEIDASHKKKDGKRSPKFIFTISTQGHSRYPFTKIDIDYPIKIVKSSLKKGDENQIYYYANQVYEMDQFVGSLVKAINRSKEPTVLVLYGDHLPALDIIKNDKSGVDKFKSLFVMVNNMGDGKIKLPKNFSSNDMSTAILKEANLPYGPMNLVHAYYRNSKDYKKILELVQYDILFGKKYFLKNNEIQKANHMRINNDKLKIDRVEERNGDYFIVGSGFNRNTKVFLNNKEVESVYYDENNIRLYDSFYMGKKSIQLKIVDSNDKIIQETRRIQYNFK